MRKVLDFICYLGELIIKYFVVYLPVLVMAVYIILWGTGKMTELDFSIKPLWDYFDYNYEITTRAASWLKETSANVESIFTLTLILIQALIVAVAAIFETFVIYFLFFGIATIIWIAIVFSFMVLFLFLIPAGAVVYSIVIGKKFAEHEDAWFHITVIILTTVSAVIHYIYLFQAM